MPSRSEKSSLKLARPPRPVSVGDADSDVVGVVDGFDGRLRIRAESSTMPTPTAAATVIHFTGTLVVHAVPVPGEVSPDGGRVAPRVAFLAPGVCRGAKPCGSYGTQRSLS
jgi:hypothetical protein